MRIDKSVAVGTTAGAATMGWGIIWLLSAVEFLRILDLTVINVSMSRVVHDLGTTVVGIQTAIAAFSLVTAAFMLTGGKLGELLGAKRSFIIGLALYGLGSLVKALSPNLPWLLLGWAVLEGLGAALLAPAILALISANYTGARRTMCLGILGGVAGAAAAAGPILGGIAATLLSWRAVFGVEAVASAIIIIAALRLPTRETVTRVRIDVVGAVLSALGLAVTIYATIQSSQWGWVKPTTQVPRIWGYALSPLGFSPVIWLLVIGIALLAVFVRWEQRVVRAGGQPLLDLELFKIPSLRAGLAILVIQQFIIAGTFFVLPLYLLTVLQMTPLATAIRLLPLSATLLISAVGGAMLSKRFSPRLIVRIGLGAIVLAELVLAAGINPSLRSALLTLSLALLGCGIGFLASQLTNVNVSSVQAERGGEVGGLQGTLQSLGSSFGTALVGAILIGSLGSGFVASVGQSSVLSPAIVKAVEARRAGGLDFVTAEEVRTIASKWLLPVEIEAVVASWEQEQINALRLSIGVVLLFGIAGLWFLRGLPDRPVPREQRDPCAAGRPQGRGSDQLWPA